MADALTTSSINSLISAYQQSESQRLISSIQTRKTKYSNLSSSYTSLSSQLTSLKSVLTDFMQTGADSVFATKAVTSSNSDFISATATSQAINSSYDMRVNQLAKSDTLVSGQLTSSGSAALTGTHTFSITTGDGSGGQYTSNVDVTFNTGETYSSVLDKISTAINSDKAVIKSNTFTATDAYTGGASDITIDLNGTQKTISLVGGGTYGDLLDEMVSQIGSAFGSDVAVEKVVDPNDSTKVSLQLTVNDSAKYISISNSSGFDVTSDLKIGVTKEKGAAGVVSASSFSPGSGTSQLSLTSKNTGLDYRIMNLSDSGTSSALNSIGLNLGATRNTYDQNASPNTAGYIYADTTSQNNQLNAKVLFNNIEIQRNSNNISDLVKGVEFNLKSVMTSTDKTSSVSVDNDTSTIKGKIKDFIDKFNSVYSFIRSKSVAGGSSSSDAIFRSDANATALRYSFSSIAFTKISTASNSNMDMLAKVGISFSSSTGLSISNDTLLSQKLSENTADVESLFNSSNGVASQLDKLVEPYLGTTGYLQTSINSFDNNVSNLSDRITAAQSRINKSADSLRSRYETLQSQYAALLTTQSMFGLTSSTTGA